MARSEPYDELAGGEQHGEELLHAGRQRMGSDTLGGEEEGPDTLGGPEKGEELLAGGEQRTNELYSTP